MLNLNYAENILNSARYSEFEVGPPLEGPIVQKIVDTLESHFNEKMEDLKQELIEQEKDLEESYESDKEKVIERMDIFHSEISDRHVDVQENIKALIELLLENDLPDFVAGYTDKILNELQRIETDIAFDLD
jgi:hypothetical protein